MHGRLEKCSICISLHYPRSDGLKMLTWSIASLIHYKGCCSVIVDKSVAGKSNCTYTNHISCLQCMEIGNKWHGILCYTSCQGSQSDNVLWRLRYALLPRRQGVTRPLRCLGYALSLSHRSPWMSLGVLHVEPSDEKSGFYFLLLWGSYVPTCY